VPLRADPQGSKTEDATPPTLLLSHVAGSASEGKYSTWLSWQLLRYSAIGSDNVIGNLEQAITCFDR
jgi:hypothetical protein